MQRGVNEAFSEAREGNSLDDSVRLGIGEAAREAADTTDQSQLNDSQVMPLNGGLNAQGRLNNQRGLNDGGLNDGGLNAEGALNAEGSLGAAPNASGQPRADFIPNGQPSRITPFGTGNIFQDTRGRNYFLDSQGRRVFTQQGIGAQVQSGASGQDPVVGNLGTSLSSNPPGPRLGVFVEPAQQGVRVMEVQANSVAQEAGIQRDDVIVSVNGQPTLNRHALIQSLGASPDGRLQLVIQRNGTSQELSATMQGSRDNYQVAKPAMDSGNQGDLSQELEALRNQIAQMNQQMEALRQEVSDLRSVNGTNVGEANETELLNNTAPTPTESTPADPASIEDASDLFGNESTSVEGNE